jgi:hypothetical protein
MYLLLLPEGQTCVTWESSKKQCSFWNRIALDRKVLLLGCKGLTTVVIAVNSHWYLININWLIFVMRTKCFLWSRNLIFVYYSDEFEASKRLTIPTCCEKLLVAHVVWIFPIFLAVAVTRARWRPFLHLPPPPPNFCQIHFSIDVASMPRSSTWSLCFRFSDQTYVRYSSHSFYMVHPSSLIIGS